MTLYSSLRRAGIFLALAVLFTSPFAYARVFQSWGRGDHVRKLESLGAKRAYESDVTVNGVPGRLSVLGFDGPLSETASRILSVTGTNVVQAGDGILIASVRDDSSPAKIVAFDLNGRTIVFHIAMERAAADPATWPIKGAPICPAGQVLFGFENKDTGTRLAVARTPESATSVRTFYDAHFGAGGWNRLSPPDVSLAAFMKGGTLCCVLAIEEPGAGAATRVVVIEKPMAAP